MFTRERGLGRKSHLRKIPQGGDMSHCFVYWTLEIRMFRGYLLVLLFYIVCFGSVTLDLRKISQSGDMSHRGFIRII